jgi:hypothetical protein
MKVASDSAIVPKASAEPLRQGISDIPAGLTATGLGCGGMSGFS